MTEEGRRLRKAINWLVFKEVVDSEADVARKLGYRRSSLSQIINGKADLSKKFVEKFCTLDENINGVWILTGEGEMLKSFSNDNLIMQETVSIPKSVWSVIEAQTASLSARDRQIDDLIAILKTQIAEKEKRDAHRDVPATSAAVG